MLYKNKSSYEHESQIYFIKTILYKLIKKNQCVLMVVSLLMIVAFDTCIN